MRVSRKVVAQIQNDFFTLFPKGELAPVHTEVCWRDSVFDRLVDEEPTHNRQRHPARQPCRWRRSSPFAATCNLLSSSIQRSRGFETHNPGVAAQRSQKRNPTERYLGDSPIRLDRRVGTCCFCDRVSTAIPCCAAPFAVLRRGHRSQRVPPQWVRTFHRLDAGRGGSGQRYGRVCLTIPDRRVSRSWRFWLASDLAPRDCHSSRGRKDSIRAASKMITRSGPDSRVTAPSSASQHLGQRVTGKAIASSHCHFELPRPGFMSVVDNHRKLGEAWCGSCGCAAVLLWKRGRRAEQS